MNLFIVCISMCVVVVQTVALFKSNDKSHKTSVRVRVMTFNIWLSGRSVENGIEKIAKHIKLNDPDIVAVQEVEDKTVFDNITRELGSCWSGHYHISGYPDTGLLTRHQILNLTDVQTYAAVSAKIRIVDKDESNSVIVNFWSVHLDYTSYGPYAACNKLVLDESQIMAGELALGLDRPGRAQEAREILMDPEFQKALRSSSQEPLILAGDFNAPSHLDWQQESRSAHCNWTFPWPATKILVEEAGLTDSFRQVHPDPVKVPGTTWSTVQKFTDAGWGWTIAEPQDRIDMILYRSKNLIPVSSETYAGNQLIRLKPNCWKNDYPSDHFAVVTDFLYTPV